MKSCKMSEAPSEILELVERLDRTRALLEAVVGAATALPESDELPAATVSVEAELARLEDALERVVAGAWPRGLDRAGLQLVWSGASWT